MSNSQNISSQPPAYQPLDVVAALQQDCQNSKFDEASRKLRRFLSFCLAVDYSLIYDRDEALPREEWLSWLKFGREVGLHYKRLAHAELLEQFWGEPPHVDELIQNMWRKVDSRIIDPAIALGVPPCKSDQSAGITVLLSHGN